MCVWPFGLGIENGGQPLHFPLFPSLLDHWHWNSHTNSGSLDARTNLLPELWQSFGVAGGGRRADKTRRSERIRWIIASLRFTIGQMRRTTFARLPVPFYLTFSAARSTFQVFNLIRLLSRFRLQPGRPTGQHQFHDKAGEGAQRRRSQRSQLPFSRQLRRWEIPRALFGWVYPLSTILYSPETVGISFNTPNRTDPTRPAMAQLVFQVE